MKEWKRERNHKKSLCLEPLEETHTTTQPCGNHRLLLWSRHKKRIPGKVSAWPSPIKHQIKNISKALVHFNFKTGAKWSENLSSPTSNSRLIRRNWLWAGDTYAPLTWLSKGETHRAQLYTRAAPRCWDSMGLRLDNLTYPSPFPISVLKK